MTREKISTSTPRVEIVRENGQAVIHLNGDWVLKAGLVDLQREDRSLIAEASTVVFESKRLGEWDSSLVSFLMEVHRLASSENVQVETDSLPEAVRRLLHLATAVPEHRAGDANADMSVAGRVGSAYLRLQDGFVGQISFLGDVALGIGRLLLGRSAMRFRDFWLVVEDHGPRALPIVALICFLVGLIVAFLGSVVLTQFGAGVYNAHLVGYGMFRELGALMTGIIMVGRSGAAFAAEIGTMKVSEEIDAFKTLGISAVDYIVIPRILALFLMMPLLTVVGDMVGVLGGLLVSNATMDIAPRLFLSNLFGAVGLSDFWIGVVKGTVFGALIAISGCLRGMQCGRSADAVGKATTSAVVTGITLIITANALIDWLASIK